MRKLLQFGESSREGMEAKQKVGAVLKKSWRGTGRDNRPAGVPEPEPQVEPQSPETFHSPARSPGSIARFDTEG